MFNVLPEKRFTVKLWLIHPLKCLNPAEKLYTAAHYCKPEWAEQFAAVSPLLFFFCSIAHLLLGLF